MASALTYTTAVKNAMQDAITTQAGTSAVIRIYDGSAPASANAALSSNTLLVTLACSSAFAAGASSGVLTANAISSGTAVATSTPTFFRILKSDLTTVIAQGTAGATASDLNLSGLSGGQIIIGGTVSISSLTLTNGN